MSARAGRPRRTRQPYNRRVFGLLYRLTSDRETAEDLMQETFLRVVRTIDRYEHAGRFEAWLFRIAANLARDRARRRGRRGETLSLDGAADDGTSRAAELSAPRQTRTSRSHRPNWANGWREPRSAVRRRPRDHPVAALLGTVVSGDRRPVGRAAGNGVGPRAPGVETVAGGSGAKRTEDVDRTGQAERRRRARDAAAGSSARAEPDPDRVLRVRALVADAARDARRRQERWVVVRAASGLAAAVALAFGLGTLGTEGPTVSATEAEIALQQWTAALGESSAQVTALVDLARRSMVLVIGTTITNWTRCLTRWNGRWTTWSHCRADA